MTRPLLFLCALSLTATTSANNGSSTELKSPTEVAYKWKDPMTVIISWNKPDSVPKDVRIKYEVQMPNALNAQTPDMSVKESFLTSDMRSNVLEVKIFTVSEEDPQNRSVPVPLTISPYKQKADLVKDFKCVIQTNELNCSWIPVNRSLNLTVRYRVCNKGVTETRKITTCEPHRPESPERHRCILRDKDLLFNTCFFVETNSSMTTFKPQLVLNPPRVHIKEENNQLQVTLTPPIDRLQCLIFNVCYTLCNMDQPCHTLYRVTTMKVTYNKACQYKFQAQALMKHCSSPGDIPQSKLSEPVLYGSDKPTDMMIYIVAIFVSITLIVCSFLLCYWLKKYRHIFWPSIPDPSVLFKQMMNENNDLKAPGGNLYTPVPEHIDPLRITLIPNS